MSQVKQIKIPGGEAFIEIGKDYIRLGTGSETFLLLDKKNLSAGASSINWQCSPSQMTYYGIMNNVNPILGMIPIAPKYTFTPAPLLALANIAITNSIISSAVGMVG